MRQGVKRDNSVKSKTKRHFLPSLVSKIPSIVHSYVRRNFFRLDYNFIKVALTHEYVVFKE
jgi:hypothetical protein